ncbi:MULTISPECIES: hypothetical protein [unclassified Chitinophaga]|uniref:hypothetical protein n=1 Tax=unclassified Chitinophaga TaxID=2619133 RepID=UPI00117C3980|nr:MULTISPECIES: hypothetical protein [unclassified Chitinophaga]WPV64824.1 hypothetical protein QQL36_23765 [Chitinophaga sp. LS1]
MKKLFLFLCLGANLHMFAQTSYDTLRTNYIGVGGNVNSAFPLNVGGISRFSEQVHFGEWYDAGAYGKVQISRLADQGDNAFHLSFVRAGSITAGMGFLRNSNTFAIQTAASNNSSTKGIFMTSAGNVGVNNSSPTVPLDVTGNIRLSGNFLYLNTYGALYSDVNNIALFADGGLFFGDRNNTYPRAIIESSGVLRLYNSTSHVTTAYVSPNGDSYLNSGGLAIGFTSVPANYKLAVNGTIGATKLKVTQSWADYVFSPDYKLPALKDVEAHIKANNKLPDIPSEKQIAAEGLDVGEMQKLQMQKIEELTLYIIDLEKRLQKQQHEIDELKTGK